MGATLSSIESDNKCLTIIENPPQIGSQPILSKCHHGRNQVFDTSHGIIRYHDSGLCLKPNFKADGVPLRLEQCPWGNNNGKDYRFTNTLLSKKTNNHEYEEDEMEIDNCFNHSSKNDKVTMQMKNQYMSYDISGNLVMKNTPQEWKIHIHQSPIHHDYRPVPIINRSIDDVKEHDYHFGNKYRVGGLQEKIKIPNVPKQRTCNPRFHSYCYNNEMKDTHSLHNRQKSQHLPYPSEFNQPQY
jgi:hypothetical protein